MDPDFFFLMVPQGDWAVSLMICWARQCNYKIWEIDWVLKDPKPPSMSGWLLTGVPRFSSTESLILHKARLTASQSQVSKKVKAEASRFLRTQALGLTQWHFHHIIIGSINSRGQAQIQRGGETVPLDGT